MTFHQFTYIITAVSLFATWLNVRKNRFCFYIWVVTNTLWAAYDFSMGATAQGLLFTCYTGLAIYGVVSWRRER